MSQTLVATLLIIPSHMHTTSVCRCRSTMSRTSFLLPTLNRFGSTPHVPIHWQTVNEHGQLTPGADVSIFGSCNPPLLSLSLKTGHSVGCLSGVARMNGGQFTPNSFLGFRARQSPSNRMPLNITWLTIVPFIQYHKSPSRSRSHGCLLESSVRVRPRVT